MLTVCGFATRDGLSQGHQMDHRIKHKPGSCILRACDMQKIQRSKNQLQIITSKSWKSHYNFYKLYLCYALLKKLKRIIYFLGLYQ